MRSVLQNDPESVLCGRELAEKRLKTVREDRTREQKKKNSTYQVRDTALQNQHFLLRKFRGHELAEKEAQCSQSGDRPGPTNTKQERLIWFAVVYLIFLFDNRSLLRFLGYSGAEGSFRPSPSNLPPPAPPRYMYIRKKKQTRLAFILYIFAVKATP